MPKISYNKPPKPEKKIKKNELTCSMCTHIKKNTEFYVSYNPLHKTGRLPYCKICLQDMCLDKDGNINIEKTKEMLKMIDRPFLYEILKISAEDKMNTIGCYFKNIAMPQYRYLGWKDSEFEPKVERKNPELVIEENVESDFEVTPEIIEKWGEGYKDEEYRLFEKKYNRLIRSYSAKTEMHSEALLIYIRYRVKEEMASAKSDAKEAKTWGELASKAALDAKINPAQMSKSDISGGVDVVTQLFETVESEVGIIPFLPKLLEQPYDDADMVIWSIVNYNRRLEEKPTIRYRDIYNYYDEMLREHYKANGWNEEQIEIFLKKRNNVFRDLEEIYIEPLYSKQSYEDGEE